MHDEIQQRLYFTQARRAFLSRTAQGLGSVALSSLMGGWHLVRAEACATERDTVQRWPGVCNPPLHPAKVKRVIWLYMAGGMSHLETWDYKPKLAEMGGQPMPESVTKGQQIAQLQGQKLNCFAPQHPFKRWGQAGLEFSSVFPEIGSRVADHLCIIRSMHTEAINHDPAHTFMNTGTMIAGRPSMGAWLLYGLGSEAENLPGFVVMVSTGKYGQSQPIAARQWHSGFLPSSFQGVEFRSKGDPVMYVSNPKGITPQRQRDVVDAVERLNRIELEAVDDPEIATRIGQYEMAFRMQTGAPELMNLADEPAHILEMYGT